VVKPWNTVVEMPGYLSDASGVLDNDERAEVVKMVAADPECGDLIPGTGGVRKVRVALRNRGKSAGARVIYYFLNEGYPVLLLALFTKAEKGNLFDGGAQCARHSRGAAQERNTEIEEGTVEK
jgi:hypothetical protein